MRAGKTGKRRAQREDDACRACGCRRRARAIISRSDSPARMRMPSRVLRDQQIEPDRHRDADADDGEPVELVARRRPAAATAPASSGGMSR